jgi:GNAT superfamily N-acetyltransferase
MGIKEKMNIIDADLAAIENYGICGYKDSKKPAFQQKLAWLQQRFKEGLKVKFLQCESSGVVGSIEYMPGEKAWRGIHAPGYMVIHCIFILKKNFKGKGYGSQLIKACEEDAASRKMNGVTAVATRSTWMAKKEVYLRNGYECVEQAPPHYELLVKRFKHSAPLPRFSHSAQQNLSRYGKGLTIIHSNQCPYVIKTMDEIPTVARKEFGIEPSIVKLENRQPVQNSPNPYGVFSIIWNGELVADHPISKTRFKNIMKKLFTL